MGWLEGYGFYSVLDGSNGRIKWSRKSGGDDTPRATKTTDHNEAC